MKFFKGKCGTVVTKLFETDCEGGHLEELIPNTTDAAGEKHVPVIAIDGQVVTVKVGEVAHPMVEAHFIEWVVLQTNQGIQKKDLKAGMEPEVCFAICEGEKVEAVYAYCNLHGLWKKEA